MKRHLFQLLKFVNLAWSFISCLYLISKSLGIFALVVAIFVTYLNMKIDEILKGTD
jgi:hypothetical protein